MRSYSSENIDPLVAYETIRPSLQDDSAARKSPLLAKDARSEHPGGLRVYRTVRGSTGGMIFTGVRRLVELPIQPASGDCTPIT
jgi:hypothetical protein